jgi:hypothetical protein
MHTTPKITKETWDMLCANAFGARRRVTDVQSTLCRSEKLNCSSNVLIARYAFPWGFPLVFCAHSSLMMARINTALKSARCCIMRLTW